MCKFFSFISDGNGKVFYANARMREERFEEPDSHTHLAKIWINDKKNPDDYVNKYEYANAGFKIDQINVVDDSILVKMWVEEFAKSEEFYQICEIACRQDGYALQFVPEKLHTKELYEMACERNGWALQYVPKEFRTEKLCEIACKQNGYALRYVPEEFRTKKLCKIVGGQDRCVEILSELADNSYVH